MATTDISIASGAAILAGGTAISSFNEGSVESDAADKFYGMIVDTLLASNPWGFARAEAQLSLHTTAPLDIYAKAYQLPADFISLLSVNEEVVDYEIYENKRLHTDWDGDVIIQYIYRPSEDKWPGYFISSVTLRLASLFAVPVTEDNVRAKDLYEEFKDFFDEAKRIDSKNRRGNKIGGKHRHNRFPLTNVR